MARIAFYGSSLLSAYWNGAATYYRGILAGLAGLGHEITFLEPDVHDRQAHRDIDPPDWAEVVVWEGTARGLRAAAARAAEADIVVKASGVGYEDDLLLTEVMAAARPGATRVFWDVDAPATLKGLRADPGQPLALMLSALDLVLTYGGGDPVVRAYRAMGAREVAPIYNALDPGTHHPVPPDSRFAADLAFLGNRLPDRDARVAAFLFGPAEALPGHRFLLGGAGWEDVPVPPNVVKLGHVPTALHNAFNATPRMVLNVARDSMAATGFSPATRVFEAAGAGACLLTDAWEGIGMFLEPGREVLVARDGAEVAAHLARTTPAGAAAIGRAARARVLASHTYEFRAAEAHRLLTAAAAREAAE